MPAPSHAPVRPTTASDEPSNTVLLALVAAGDSDAWSVVVGRYRNLLLHVTRRHRLAPDEAADVMQQTWMRFLERVNDIRDPECVAGWLATTATRECIAHRRRRWRETPGPECTVDSPETWDVDDRLDAAQRSAELRRAIATLPRRERELVEALLDPEELTYAQLSRRLSMPVGSIGPIRGRALRRLRDLLDAGAYAAEPPLTA